MSEKENLQYCKEIARLNDIITILVENNKQQKETIRHYEQILNALPNAGQPCVQKKDDGNDFPKAIHIKKDDGNASPMPVHEKKEDGNIFFSSNPKKMEDGNTSIPSVHFILEDRNATGTSLREKKEDGNAFRKPIHQKMDDRNETFASIPVSEISDAKKIHANSNTVSSCTEPDLLITQTKDTGIFIQTVSPQNENTSSFYRQQTNEIVETAKPIRTDYLMILISRVVVRATHSSLQNTALVLMRLQESPKQSLKDLQKLTKLSEVGITKRIQSMKRFGLIIRASGRQLLLTEKAKQMLEEAGIK